MPPPDAPTQPDDDVPQRFSVDFTGLVLLGTYRVDRRIADGGMGGIYLGEDTNLGRKVVIKIPHTRFLGEPGFRTRFRREIAELVRFEHPHIVRILAQGEHEDVPFFVLQYLGGGSLEDRLDAAHGPGSPEEVLGWLATIARTLDFVHARGTVHRDVKPANILFDDDDHVFLSDFGVAKALEDHDVGLTEMGASIGSPLYMAPEQAVGADPSPAADQYSLGAMVYEALVGSPPFTGKSMIDVLVAKRSQAPAPIADLASELPPGASSSVMRALSADPSDRFPSCGAFARAFEEGLRIAESPRHARPRVLLAAVAFAVLVVGVLAFTLFGPSGGEPRTGGASNEVAALRLTLLDAGAEPRRAMRYLLTEGSVEQVELRLANVMKLEGAPPAPGLDIPRTTWLLEMTVEKVMSDGSAAVRWRTKSVTFEFAPDTVEQLRNAMARLLPHYETFACTAVLSPNGLVRESHLDLAEGVPAIIRREFQKLFWTVRNLAVPYPVEPVGLGARWEVTEAVDLEGLRLTHTMTHELVESDEDHARLIVYAKQVALPQPMNVAEFAKDIDARLLDLDTTGKAEIVADMRHAAPRTWNFDMQMRMKLEATALDEQGKPTGDPETTSMTMDMDAELTRK